MVAALLDDHLRSLLTAGATELAPRVSDLIGFAREWRSPKNVLASIAGLERRGLVAVQHDPARPWTDGALNPPRELWWSLVAPPDRWPAPTVRLPKHIARQIDRVVLAASEVVPITIAIRGPLGSGHDTVARHLAERLEWRERTVVSPATWRDEQSLVPEISLGGVVWDQRDPAPSVGAKARRFLERALGPVVVLLGPADPAPTVPGRVLHAVELAARSRAEQEDVWSSVSVDESSGSSTELAARIPAGLDDLVTLSFEGPVSEARLDAHLIERHRSEMAAGVTLEEPRSAAEEELVLDPVPRAAFDRWLELVKAYAHRPARRPGLRALFTGPSGVGKTLAARITAASRGRPLLRIDLSTTISKWVGETEKNLRRALALAESLGAVLLIDEGDALMGRRGGIEKGTDRYANLEVAYLLQAIETHDGICVVTTNLPDNVDPAFARRFEVVLRLERPTGAASARIWRRELGATLDDQTLLWLARSLDLSGGSIAAVGAVAWGLAKARGRAAPSRQEILEAAEGELQKTGASLTIARLREHML